MKDKKRGIRLGEGSDVPTRPRISVCNHQPKGESEEVFIK